MILPVNTKNNNRFFVEKMRLHGVLSVTGEYGYLHVKCKRGTSLKPTRVSFCFSGDLHFLTYFNPLFIEDWWIMSTNIVARIKKWGET